MSDKHRATLSRRSPGGGSAFGLRWRQGLAGLSTVALVALGSVVGTTAANADPAENANAFTQDEPGNFNATAPDGVCAVQVIALGAAGGSSIDANETNGAGASITATYPITPGASVTGVVGEGGKNGGLTSNVPGPGGTPGGGSGSDNDGYSNVYHNGAGGGGLTLVSIDGTDLVVAGGGGGSAGGHTPRGETYGYGGDAGLPSEPGVASGSDGERGFDGTSSQDGSGGAGGGIPNGGQGGQPDGPGAGGTHTLHSNLDGSPGSSTNGGDAGDDTGADGGAGGGAGYYGGGGGASTIMSNQQDGGSGITGAGGGGGASYVAPETGGGGAVSGISSELGSKRNGSGAGADGSVTLNWIMCDYDLSVEKQVTEPGSDGVVTWTITVTNEGADDMAIGDTVTLEDTLPAPANTEIESIDAPEGVTTDDIEVGGGMVSPVEFARGDGSGLKVDETITIVYTQSLTTAGSYENTATVTDRNPDDDNDSSEAEVVIEGPKTDNGETRSPKGEEQRWSPTPEDGTFPVDCADTLTLRDEDGDWVTEIAVPGEGTYTVDDCEIVFTPDEDFTGKATMVTYRVSDSKGNTATGEYTPTVLVRPTAVNDESEGPWNEDQSSRVLDNDEPGDEETPLDPAALTLLGEDGNPAIEVTVDDGQYSIDRTDGAYPRVVFTPNEDYYGAPTPVDYTVEDTNGTETGATYQPFVYAPPIAEPVKSEGLQGQEQSHEPDVAKRNVELDQDSLKIWDPESEEWTTDPVTIDSEQGTYSIKDGELVFTPVSSFTGEATAVNYQMTDERDQTAESTYTPTVTPVTPVANDDESEERANNSQSSPVLENDEAGNPAVPLDPESLALVGADEDGVVTVGEGKYSIDRFEEANPRIVFTPNENYFGTPTPVEYTVGDANGTKTGATYQPEVIADQPETNNGKTEGPQGLPQSWEPTPTAGQDFEIDWSTLTLLDEDGNPVDEIVVDGQGMYTVDGDKLAFTPEPQFVGTADPVDYRISDVGGQHAEGTYTPKTNPVTPQAVDDSSVEHPNMPQSSPVLENDEAGNPAVPLDPESLALVGADEDGVVTVGEGKYSIDRFEEANPRIVFTPNENYFGTPTPVEYTVGDANGTKTGATYQPEVIAEPLGTNDGETTGPQGLRQTWEPTPAAGDDFAIDWSTLTLLDEDGEPVDEIEVEGVGTYTVDEHEIVFTPERQFVGDAPTVDYRISDVGGQNAVGTYTPSTFAVTPIANDDATSNWWNTPQIVDPLVNDTPGNPEVPLVPESLMLLDEDGEPATEVTVPEGIYSIDSTDPENPVVVFTPNHGYTGTPTQVDYIVEDANGTTAQAVYRPIVKGPEAVLNLNDKLVCGTPVVFDMAAEVEGLDPHSVMLLDENGQPVTELKVDGEGTWKVDAETGKVTFTPEGCFVGALTTVKWEGWLENGAPTAGELDVTYAEQPPLTNTGSNMTAFAAVLGVGAGLLLTGAGVYLLRRRTARV